MTEPSRFRSRTFAIVAALGLLAVGGGIGSAVTHAVQRPLVMAPTAPVPIATLATMTEPAFGTRIVTVRGKVAEVYGDRFVLADNSGRTLIEAGGGRGDGSPVVVNQGLSVQGHFDHDVLHAAFLIGADGSVVAVGGPRGRHGHHGGDRHHDRGPEAAAEVNAPAPAAAGA